MEWRANWIWARSHGDTPNFYLYARREFEVHASSSARLFVTCSSEYKLYINGRYVGRGPGPCHPSFHYYDDYDVSHMVRPGRNVIGVICYNQGVDTLSRPETPGGLLLQTEVHNSGEVEFVVTNEEWRVWPAEDWDSASERVAEYAGFSEPYDSRKKPVAWTILGYDDSRWQTPEMIGPVGTEPWTSMLPREIPHLRESEAFARRIAECGPDGTHDGIGYARAMLDLSADSAVVTPGQESCVVLDFGTEVVGYPRISVRDGAVATVDIGCGETPEAAAACTSDRLVLHGGRQEWEGFQRRAFRYVRLGFRDVTGQVHIESVSANRVGYPIKQVSTFECSDEMLNGAWRAGVNALSACMQDTYESCPSLERGQCIADARVQALANYYCFFDTKLSAKTLAEFARGQHEDGMLYAAYPSGPRRIIPDQSLSWIQMLHDYHLYTGDKSLVQQLYPNLHLLIERWCRGEQDVHGLLSRRPDLSVDIVTYNALFYQALRDAAKLASATGAVDDSVEWMAKAEIVREAFNEQYWSEERGAYADTGDTHGLFANALAVLHGLADARQLASVRDTVLTDSPNGNESHLALPVLQTLAKVGETARALTELSARWGVIPPVRASAVSAVPVCFLQAEVLGVKPSMPGSGVVIVQPRPGNLEWAKGSIKTHNSLVNVEWESGPRRFTLEIEAPEGFIAALPIGRFQNPEIQEIDLSPDTPERRARRTYGWTDLVWRDGVEHDPYVDWLKTQESEPPNEYRAKKRLFREEEYIWVRESASTHVRYEISESP